MNLTEQWAPGYQTLPSRGPAWEETGTADGHPPPAVPALTRTYFAGRTSTCMKPPSALMLWIRIWVPVLGCITLPSGFVGS